MATVSENTSRMLPVAASATRSFSSLWSREVDTNASCVPSALQFTSSNPRPALLMSSESEPRRGSGAIWKRTTFGPFTSMMTRSMVVMSLSPGSGYFQDLRVGLPMLVVTRYMSLTLRWSCWKVAILRESGDQSRMGRSLWVQPALSVA